MVPISLSSRSSWLSRGFLCVALATCLHVPSVSAAIIYDEAVSGDLNGNQGALPGVGALVLGTNTFKGFHSIATDLTGGQGDGFKVTLNPLHVLTSITLTLTNYTLTDPTTAGLVRPAGPAVTFAVFQRFGPVSGNQVFTFNIPTTLPAELGFSLQLGSGNQPTSYNWQWDVVVAEAQTQAVPEASSALLLAAGLAGLGAWRRYRA